MSGSRCAMLASDTGTYLMRQVISGHQWSSVVISGHQWSSVVISGHQRSSDAGTHLPELVVCQKRAVAGVVYRDVWNEPNALMVSAPSSRPSSWPNSTRTCHQWSSLVIIDHQWSSVVISGHQIQHAREQRACGLAAAWSPPHTASPQPKSSDAAVG